MSHYEMTEGQDHPSIASDLIERSVAAAAPGLTWPERVASYKAYAKSRRWPGTIAIDDHGWVFGFWICGNDYTVKSGYYGGYPRTYLERVKALFPDTATDRRRSGVGYDRAPWAAVVSSSRQPRALGSCRDLSQPACG